MPVSEIQNVKDIAHQFKQTAESIASGWEDAVKDRFFENHIEEIYQSVNHFYEQALSDARSLEEKNREIDMLRQSIEYL